MLDTGIPWAEAGVFSAVVIKPSAHATVLITLLEQSLKVRLPFTEFPRTEDAADAKHWAGKVSKDYRMLLLDEGEEQLKEVRSDAGHVEVKVVRKGMKRQAVEVELVQLDRSRDVALRKMPRCRVRYFSDGAVY